MAELAHRCERARFRASLRLDNELSELEGALLDAHLARCAGCQRVVAGFRGSTSALRSATLGRVAPLAAGLPRWTRRLVAEPPDARCSPRRTTLPATRRLLRDVAAESV
jgi:predicted anti-sigma-YlaC factor YlaD